jgi:hypothetical protein
MRYRIVPERSTVWIDARSSLHPIHSSTDGLEGFIELEHIDGDDVRLATPPAGFLALPVDRLSSGNPLEDRELRKRVDTKRFPTIEGRMTGWERIDSNRRYRVRGDLTFRGITRPCQDELSIVVLDDRTVRLEGRSTFDIRDFGMQPPKILLMRVAPEVAVRIEVIAEREDVP